MNDFSKVGHEIVVITSFIAFLGVQDPWTTSAPRIVLSATKRPHLIRSRKYVRSLITVILVLVSGSGCSPAIAPFSGRAYELAVDLKVDAIRTMERAEESFSKHERRVESLQIRMQKAVEFARGRPNNSASTRQWEIMADPDGHMVGGFLSRWQEEDSLSWGFIREASSQVEDGFDAIIGLESGKVGSKQ